MELKERIALIIKENNLKQKELAAIMGVSESYVSYILAGRNTNLSTAVANLIEEKLGYSALWVLKGDDPKYRLASKNPRISNVHRKVIYQLEKMPDEKVKAVLAFIDSLDKIESTLTEKED